MNIETSGNDNLTGIKTFSIFGLICIILLEILLTVYCGLNKNGYYGDEGVSYLLANDVNGGFLQLHEDALNNWVDGDYYSDLMTMKNNRLFDFSVPYHNQELDVHPPLYYFAVHFFCSLFPDGDWKWIGIGINLLFGVVLSVFLFLLARRISHSFGLSLLTVFGYVISLGFINTVTFLRMYTMLTMWCVIFVWILTGLVQNVHENAKIPFRTYIGLFFITLAGTLTQYYFLIFAFFICLCALIYLLIKKQWILTILFTVSESAGIVSAAIFFPAMINQIFFGYRGTEAIESIFDFNDYLKNLNVVFSILNEELFGGLLIPAIIILLILIVMTYISTKVFKNRTVLKCNRQTSIRRPSFPREGWAGLILVSCICYVLLVVDISPYVRNRYYMCLYPFIIFVCVLSVYDILSVFLTNRLHTYTVVLCCLLITTTAEYVKYSPTYLWSMVDAESGNSTTREEILSPYDGYPLILIDFKSNNTFMHGFIYDWKKASKVYHFNGDTYTELDNVLKNSHLNNGFLIYIANESYVSDTTSMSSEYSGLQCLEKLSEYYPMTFDCVLTNGEIETYFCIPEQN